MLLELTLIDPRSSYSKTVHILIFKHSGEIIIDCTLRRYYTYHSIVVLTKLYSFAVR